MSVGFDMTQPKREAELREAMNTALRKASLDATCDRLRFDFDEWPRRRGTVEHNIVLSEKLSPSDVSKVWVVVGDAVGKWLEGLRGQ